MGRPPLTRVALVTALLAVAACGRSATSPTAAPPVTTSIVGVIPAGGATSVTITTVITISFNHEMMGGMESYVGLHVDSLLGPSVAGRFAWSADRTQLTFTPAGPLKPQTTYVLHIGGGMIDANRAPIDYGQCRALGGRDVTEPMMGSGGMMGEGEMGQGWRGRTGGYGMQFVFTTA